VRITWPIVLALSTLSVLGCTSSDDMNLLHREITDVQRQIQDLEASTLDKSDLTTMEKHFSDLTATTVRSNADLAQKVSALEERLETLHATLEVTSRRLEKISQELASTRASLARPALPPVTVGDGSGDAAAAGSLAGAPADSTATPEELYRSSYEDYLRGNYDLAAQGFREYLRRWPDTDLSDNAQYWVGECLDALEQTQPALDAFSELLERFPTSDKAAAAQLKKGLLYLKLGNQGQGVVHLQYVVFEHPGTQEADLARERLRSLGLTIR
jgi:tol-pal system protein YbgF